MVKHMCTPATVQDVVPDGGVEQHRLLPDKADLPTPPADVQLVKGPSRLSESEIEFGFGLGSCGCGVAICPWEDPPKLYERQSYTAFAGNYETGSRYGISRREPSVPDLLGATRALCSDGDDARTGINPPELFPMIEMASMLT